MSPLVNITDSQQVSLSYHINFAFVLKVCFHSQKKTKKKNKTVFDLSLQQKEPLTCQLMLAGEGSCVQRTPEGCF